MKSKNIIFSEKNNNKILRMLSATSLSDAFRVFEKLIQGLDIPQSYNTKTVLEVYANSKGPHHYNCPRSTCPFAI